jgi:hypothetical protein
LSASAAQAPPGTSAETAMIAAIARREILDIVVISMGVDDQSGPQERPCEGSWRRRLLKKRRFISMS